jgi:beta-galactosidase
MGLLIRRYSVFDNGTVLVSCIFTPYKFIGEERKTVHQMGPYAITIIENEHELPRRFGLQAEMTNDIKTMIWFGKGHHDTYWGREFSGIVDIHTKNVTEQDEHVRPQEHGNKRGVRWVEFTDCNGKGLKAEAEEKEIAASAWPYTLEDLHDARHIIDLPEFLTTTINIDCIQNGLGDCFVPLEDKYKIQPDCKYEYGFILSVI